MFSSKVKFTWSIREELESWVGFWLPEGTSTDVSVSEGMLSSSRRKESLMFCRLRSSVSELVEDRFLRFLHDGEEEFTVSGEIEGPIADSFRVSKKQSKF